MDIPGDDARGDLAGGQEAHLDVSQSGDAREISTRAAQRLDAETGGGEELLGLFLETAFGRNGELQRGHDRALPKPIRPQRGADGAGLALAAAEPRDQAVVAAAGHDRAVGGAFAGQFENEAVIVFEAPASLGAEHGVGPEGRRSLASRTRRSL